uniref:C-type lectin domain-containing protein n=1 Tax=Oryzias sinensis TaxID=183150 RepID=A0A8C7WSD2_9TELE
MRSCSVCIYFQHIEIDQNTVRAEAWTYAYSKGSNLQWHEARQWCQKHFVDMVSIKNKEEAEYLDSFLPHNPTYYWIGVQKVAAKWTWVDTSKPVPLPALRSPAVLMENVRRQWGISPASVTLVSWVSTVRKVSKTFSKKKQKTNS